ncbi:MAG TPA: hypothetical protein VM390_08980, partial [Acidimicrobiales bacterium]|nr:hypothetical protein [Acidimicrobiales bacterium]
MIPALLGGLASKLAGMGVAAKAGIGLGIAATATAGVAAVLPPAADNATNADAGAGVTASVELPSLPSLPSLPVDVTLPSEAGFGLQVAADATAGAAGAGAQFGLDVANRTPAAGNVPTSVPAGPPASVPAAQGQGSGQPEATGLDRARQTPAG